MSALQQAAQLVDLAKRDPISAVDKLEKVGQLLKRAHLEGGTDRALLDRFDRWLARSSSGVLADVQADRLIVASNNGAVAPGTNRNGIKVEWPGGVGLCTGIFAGVVDGQDASLSAVAVRITIDGDKDLFSDGQNPAYVPLVALHARDNRWFRLEREVNGSERWMVSFTHQGAPGAAAVQPFLVFAYQQRK
jgi:hypothetical protein